MDIHVGVSFYLCSHVNVGVSVCLSTYPSGSLSFYMAVHICIPMCVCACPCVSVRGRIAMLLRTGVLGSLSLGTNVSFASGHLCGPGQLRNLSGAQLIYDEGIV